MLISGGSWEGPLSWRKPATFGLSFGVTLINITWIATSVSLKDRMRMLLLGIFAAACVLETSLVSLQAWRGVPSHFNVETPFDGAVAQTLAVGGFTLVAVVENALGRARTVAGYVDGHSAIRGGRWRYDGRERASIGASPSRDQQAFSSHTLPFPTCIASAGMRSRRASQQNGIASAWITALATYEVG